MTTTWWPTPDIPELPDNIPDQPLVGKGIGNEVDWPAHPDQPQIVKDLYGRSS